MSALADTCSEIYHESGQQAVFNFILTNFPNIKWYMCEPCEIVSPSESGECLVCGSLVRRESE